MPLREVIFLVLQYRKEIGQLIQLLKDTFGVDVQAMNIRDRIENLIEVVRIIVENGDLIRELIDLFRGLGDVRIPQIEALSSEQQELLDNLVDAFCCGEPDDCEGGCGI